jgi:D-tagatose-1,6-bisphosphate aldolase subunit GatZ/KbaZ
VRYYWADPEVDAAARKLLSNLASMTIPENLLSQFLPTQYWELRRGAIGGSPESMVRSKVRELIRSYAKACGARRA